MQVRQRSNGKSLTLDPRLLIRSGGEGSIYSLPDSTKLLAKIYHRPTDEHGNKLAAMMDNPPASGSTIAWPADLLLSANGSNKVLGFLMPRVNGARNIIDVYNPKTRLLSCPSFTYRYLYRTARNLAASFQALHARQYVVGDVNESNILVAETAVVSLVDADSFQVRDPRNNKTYRCSVGKPEFTPPELQGKSFANVDRSPAHDSFGLGVLIFQLLMEGWHPFLGVPKGPRIEMSLQERIRDGHFPYAVNRPVQYKPSPIALPFEMLHPSVRRLLLRCFEDGHSNPDLRPSPQDWQRTLEDAENSLVSCPKNGQHQYGKHLSTCPWCERTQQLRGRDPFPSRNAPPAKRPSTVIPQKPLPPPTTTRPATTGAGLSPPVQPPTRRVHSTRSLTRTGSTRAAVAALVLLSLIVVIWIGASQFNFRALFEGGSGGGKPNPIAIRAEVEAFLKGWAGATQARDANSVMNYYGASLDPYYGRAGGTGSTKIRSDFEKAFSNYSRLSVQLGHADVTIDSDGNAVVATFDKSFDFRSEDKFFTGSVQERLWLRRIGSSWKITGQKDLKTYDVKSGPLTPPAVAANEQSTTDAGESARAAAKNTEQQAAANRLEAMAHVSKASQFFEQNDYKSAILECDSALNLDRRNAEARRLRAQIRETLKILNAQ